MSNKTTFLLIFTSAGAAFAMALLLLIVNSANSREIAELEGQAKALDSQKMAQQQGLQHMKDSSAEVFKFAEAWQPHFTAVEQTSLETRAEKLAQNNSVAISDKGFKELKDYPFDGAKLNGGVRANFTLTGPFASVYAAIASIPVMFPGARCERLALGSTGTGVRCEVELIQPSLFEKANAK